MLWWFAQTTMVAAGLAALAMLAGRSKRLGPEAKHALWLVVLIKLMIPPVVAWPWALPDAWPRREVAIKEVKPPIEDVKAPVEMAHVEPTPIPLPDLGPAPDIETIPTTDPAPEPKVEVAEAPEIVDPPIIEAKAPVPPSRPWEWSSAVIGAWLAGSVVVVARRGVRAIRFGRSLRMAIDAPGWLMDEVRATAATLGVRPPPVKVTPAVSTPLLWCLGRPTLVLPEALVSRLPVDRWPGIIAHELAHLSRLDHWVVRLELAAEAVWWWSPLFRLVRDRLREEAELACDARVVRALPDRRFAYAEALVDVCEHLIRPVSPPSPALGVVGPRASRALEGRLLMILKGPDRRPSTRLAASASLLLVAMALPAWTLGQQPEPAKVGEPPKAETPAKIADEPKVEHPKVERPANENPAIPAVLQMEGDLYKRQQSLKNLSVRYVATTRSDSPWVHRVSVQAADVEVGEGRGYRLDVYDAKPGEARPLPWARWLEIRSSSDVQSLRTESSNLGPVPILWKAEQRAPFPDQNVPLNAVFSDGYSLSAYNPSRPAYSMADRRPFYAIDLAGPTFWMLNSSVVGANIVGSETIDGREATRVAWVAKGDQGIRGIAWYAPALGQAMVRADAVMVLQHTQPVEKRIWRKKCDDFVKVGDLWLPGKVTTRAITVLADGKVTSDVEQLIQLEDYRINAELPADAFTAKLPVQSLDEVTGDFTTIPPPSAPGLLDRLKRAVAESPFGPPAEPAPSTGPGWVGEGTKPPAYPDVPAVADAAEALDKAQADLDAIIRRSRNSTDPEEVEARKRRNKAQDDFRRIGEAKLKEAEDKAANDRKVEDKARAEAAADAEARSRADRYAPADLPKLDTAVPMHREFLADPAVKAVIEKWKEAHDKFEEAKRQAGDPRDPAVLTAQKKLTTLRLEYEQLWDKKVPEIKTRLDAEAAREDARANGMIAEGIQAERSQFELRFRADPEVKTLAAKIAETQVKLDEAMRKHRDPRDPGVLAIKGKKDALQEQWLVLWEAKKFEYRESNPKQAARAAEEAANAQSVRDHVVARFEADPEVVDIAKRYKEADAKWRAMAQIQDVVGEPAVLMAQEKRDELRKQYDKLWDSKSRQIGEQVTDEIARGVPVGPVEAGETVKLAQDRRDARAVAVAKADAEWKLAKSAVARTRTNDGPGVIDFTLEGIRKIEAMAVVAEAELAVRKAELAEADEMLEQAKRPPARAESTEAADVNKLAQLRRESKVAEVARAQAQRDLAAITNGQLKTLLSRNAVRPEEARQGEADLAAAEAEFVKREAELAVAEAIVEQAKRRPERAENFGAIDTFRLLQADYHNRTIALAQAETLANELARVVALNNERIAKDPKAIKREDIQKGEEEAAAVSAKRDTLKAELAELRTRLEQLKLRPAEAKAAETIPASSSKLIDLRDAVDLLKIQLDGKKAELEGLDAALRRAEVEWNNALGLARTNAVSPKAVELSKASVAIARANVSAKKAEVSEYELRIKQAIRRAEAEETRLKRESAKAKAELDRVTPMVKSGQAAFFLFDGARNRYDELMFQLDPNHVATPDVKP